MIPVEQGSIFACCSNSGLCVCNDTEVCDSLCQKCKSVIVLCAFKGKKVNVNKQKCKCKWKIWIWINNNVYVKMQTLKRINRDTKRSHKYDYLKPTFKQNINKHVYENRQK